MAGCETKHVDALIKDVHVDPLGDRIDDPAGGPFCTPGVRVLGR